jgi:2,4-dienoyl-CoA reductase-like NADH-dependent reductase (Old Yellow Enzyme family)/thioredoxin reductase
MNQFPLLFSPLKIGSFTVRNRIMSTPHHTLFTDPDGLPGSREIAYWVSKAKGGIGLIGSHVHGVHASTGNTFAQPAAVQKFRAATEAIHEHGAKFVGQLWHPGAQGGGPGRVPWAPSTVPQPDSWSIPHAMTKDEVRQVIDGYARGAAVLREAGVDGAEIHGAHGYLITQFLSPLSNTRDDEYGGDFERRLNFPLEIIEAIRREVGRDWTVGMRISGDEMTEGGYTADDFRRIAPYLTANDELDYLSVSVGIYRSKDTIIAPMYYPSGAFVYLSAMAKEVIDIPVVCIGRINDPVMAEQVLQDNQADMVGMTRANICDPELPNKSLEGRLDEIRHCIACNEGCWGHIERQMPITCAINPAVGREEYWGEVKKTESPKRVVVVGGGPAGSEAARVAAMAGHSVTLFEKESSLGGQANIAAKGPGRVDFAEIGRYQTVELTRLGVDLRLGKKANASDVLDLQPDQVFVATGGRPRVPEHIIGSDRPNVFQAWDVLNGTAVTGEKVVVLDEEHHIQALNVAELLASQGKQVQVVTHQFEPGALMEPITRMATLRRVSALEIPVRVNTWAKEIGSDYVILFDFYTSKEERVEADSVVLACSIIPETELYAELQARHPSVRSIGDANGYRRLEQSVFEGHLAARVLDGPPDPRLFASGRRLG